MLSLLKLDLPVRQISLLVGIQQQALVYRATVDFISNVT
jgi:hypothetical protein